MKTLLALALVCWAFIQAPAATPTQTSDLQWKTDFPAAQAQAKAEKKLLFVEFTGSDWCPPCKMLKSNILSSSEFTQFAKNNLVLVELDFPRQLPQSEALKKANEALAQKYNIEGFPTVLVFDSEGKQLSRQVGYPNESAKEYVAKLQALVAKK